MTPSTASAAAQRLATFLDSIGEGGGVVTGHELRGARQAIGAEGCALVQGADVIAVDGLPHEWWGVAAWQGIRDGAVRRLKVLGETWTIVAVDIAGGDRLIACRRRPRGFSSGDVALMSAMARALALQDRVSRRMSIAHALSAVGDEELQAHEALITSLRQREQLMSAVTRVQRSISVRADLDETLRLIADAVAELLDEDLAVVRVIEPGNPGGERIAATTSSSRNREAAADTGWGALASQRAIAMQRLVILEGGGSEGVSGATRLPAIASPIAYQGTILGSVVAVSSAPNRGFSDLEREALLVLSEQAGLAVADARAAATAHEAQADPLTGLASRGYLVRRLGELLSEITDDDRIIVHFINLDRLKNVNDTLGRAAGDELLIAVSSRLRRALRPGDLIARLQGDEFAVVIRNRMEREDAIGRRILDVLKASFEIHNRPISVTGCVGIAVVDRAMTDAEEVLRNAGLAMCRAKLEGPGTCRIYEPLMHQQVVDRIELETDLQRAIDNDELTLHFQPIVDLVAGRIRGLEALLRWNHPTRGVTPPLAFIPIAEETGLIVSLGRWVLAQSLRQLREWRRDRRLPDDLFISVNISPRQLHERDIVEDIEEALDRSGIEPSALMLEITESVLLEHAEESVAKLERLRRIGVRIALDDFGTGYSSLAYLRRLPVDLIKLDKCFVDEVAIHREGRALARAIVELCAALGLDTLAEGIEMAEQLAALRDLDCHLGQGYHFARPLPAHAISVLFRGEPGFAPVDSGTSSGGTVVMMPNEATAPAARRRQRSSAAGERPA